MDRNALKEWLTMTVREELDDRKIILTDEEELADIPGWDSVIMSAVLIEAEHTHGIEFSPTEIDNLSTVDGLLDAILTKVPA